MSSRVTIGLTAVATLVTGAAVALSPSQDAVLPALTLLGAVVLGWLIVVRRTDSTVGPALAWCGAAVAVSMTAEHVADGAAGAGAASVVGPVAVGLWPVNLAGLFALLLVFPEGLPPERIWRWVPWLFVVSTGVVLAGLWGSRVVDDQVTGQAAWQPAITAIGSLGIGAAMVVAVGSVVVRFRRGDERVRDQLKWFISAGAFTVLLLVGGWAAEMTGTAVSVAYTPFVVAIVLVVPAAVAIAVVRYDLLDIDRLLSEGAAWLVTIVLSAAVFAAAVFTVAQLVHRWTTVGASLAAFVTALTILPIHTWVHRSIGRVIDRDRNVAVAAVERFAADIRSGHREPEEIESVLREAQRDPELRLLLADSGTWVGLDGTPESTDTDDGIVLESGGMAVARLVLTRETARTRRRASALLRAGWVPIEVTRLRLGLRQSQARLAGVAAEERLRLERDLHDGVQQRLVATGMRLSLLQRRLDAEHGREVSHELGTAVDELLDAVEELRRLAHGVRPSRLDDGLGPALASVAATSPVPLELSVANELPNVDDARTHAAFMTVTEAVANALKHARASRIEVAVEADHDRLRVIVRDDGAGGASGLVTLRDRVRSVGGELTIDSPAGGGTTVTALV
ncbi:MAG: histidine kinase [Actinobacteria bacterium]|nr:histidine kinase [Actinomycetota bacterium]